MIKRTCSNCSSENIIWNSCTKWNIEKQEMIIANIFDDVYCLDCESNVEAIDIELCQK